MNAIAREQHEELETRFAPLRGQAEGWRVTEGRNEKMPEGVVVGGHVAGQDLRRFAGATDIPD